MRSRTLLAGAAGLLALPAIRSARADTLDEVKKRGSLIVGMEVAYVPYEFFKDGVIVGYDPDIIADAMPKLGVKAQLIDTAWNGIIPALYAKKFDCIISAMTITAERAQKVLFSMPYADASNVIFLRADETIVKTADDLSGKTIGVQLGSAAAVIAKAFEDKMKAKGLPSCCEMKQYEHLPRKGVSGPAQQAHRCGDSTLSKSTLMVVMNDAPGKFKLIPGISDVTAYFGMAFRKEDAALHGFFNDQLAAMKTDGRLDKLQVKWFGATMPTPNTIPEVLP